MSRFTRLLRLEVVLLLRQPLAWTVFIALGIAMIAGGYNAGQYRERQLSVLAGIAAQEHRADARALSIAERVSKPSTVAVPWWKDPTDAYGYLAYNLTRFATKPPTPLAMLAVGQSDLLPYYVKSDMIVSSPEDTAYDFQNPRRLGVGSFDLAFVIIFLLPLALITLGGFRLSAEQDSGALRLIAAQPASLRTIATAKFGALAMVSIPAVLIALAAALVVGGMPALTAGWMGLLLLTTLAIVAYILFWIALSLLVVSFWRGAIVSTATLVLLWIAFTAVVPGLAALVLQTAYPAPSRLLYADQVRLATDAVNADKAGVLQRYVAAHREYADADQAFMKSNELGKIGILSAVEARTAPYDQPFVAHAHAAGNAAKVLRLMSPSLVMDQALQTAAGTDVARHAAFIQSSRDYRGALRSFLWPKALEQAAFPTPKTCTACSGRMAFNEFDRVPKYHAIIEIEVAATVALATLYLWLMDFVVTVLAFRRLKRWPPEL